MLPIKNIVHLFGQKWLDVEVLGNFSGTILWWSHFSQYLNPALGQPNTRWKIGPTGFIVKWHIIAGKSIGNKFCFDKKGWQLC
jgi:hypothetical protein